MSVTIAAFDVDGTLTTRDSVIPFLRGVRGTPGLAMGLLRRSSAVVPAVVRRRRDDLKRLATEAALRGVDVGRLEHDAAQHADRIIAGRLRPDTVGRLRWHLDEGHRVVLVSASYEVYLDPLGEHLGVDAVLGTRLEVVDGHCTGALDGPNCRGTEKVRRLHAWLDQFHGGRSQVTIWAYGDSAGDDALLADADHPVRVRGPVASVPAREFRH